MRSCVSPSPTKMVADGCVNCHNSHPQTPKTGWKLGDVRGVLEVDTVITNQLAAGNAISNNILGIVVAVTAIILVIIFLLVRARVTQPIQQATHSAARISEGNLEQAIQTHSSGEVGHLLSALERMRLKLRDMVASEEEGAQNARIRLALDKVSAGVMVIGLKHEIIYYNESSAEMFRTAEEDIQQVLPEFSAERLNGIGMESFYPNPEEQKQLLTELADTDISDLQLGGRTFRLITNPVFGESGERLGTAVEWTDRTQEVGVEEEIDNIVIAAANGDFSQRIVTVDKEGFYQRLGDGINQVLTNGEAGLTEVVAVLRALAEGDLTQQVESDYQGILGKVKEATNSTVGRLREVLTDVSDNADIIANASEQVSATAQNLSHGASEQASSVEETSASIEQMSASINQNSENAKVTDGIATDASKSAVDGGEAVKETVGAMKQIAEKINIIEEIAYQTNMLALNAANRGRTSWRARQRLCGGCRRSAKTGRTLTNRGVRDR